jgi:hypothetical protein
VASEHGATAGIGTALARALADSDVGRAAGLQVASLPVEQRPGQAEAPTPFYQHLHPEKWHSTPMLTREDMPPIAAIERD